MGHGKGHDVVKGMIDAMQRASCEHGNFVDDDDVPRVKPRPLLAMFLGSIDVRLVKAPI